MNRRSALKAIGLLVAIVAGKPVGAAEQTDGVLSLLTYQYPIDYRFTASGIRNIIIERDGEKPLIIPFSDIVAALEKPCL